jgi:hypothetical protein
VCICICGICGICIYVWVYAYVSHVYVCSSEDQREALYHTMEAAFSGVGIELNSPEKTRRKPESHERVWEMTPFFTFSLCVFVSLCLVEETHHSVCVCVCAER